MSSKSAYSNFLSQIRKIGFVGPLPPKNYNYHHYIPSPFKKLHKDLNVLKIQRNSERYDKLYGTNLFPIPTVIQRHLLIPQQPLLNQTSLGRIQGFRIEIKGRNGSRSARKVLSYGKLSTGRLDPITGSMVDYGSSAYTNPKRGVTGVKVWVCYGSN